MKGVNEPECRIIYTITYIILYQMGSDYKKYRNSPYHINIYKPLSNHLSSKSSLNYNPGAIMSATDIKSFAHIAPDLNAV